MCTKLLWLSPRTPALNRRSYERGSTNWGKKKRKSTEAWSTLYFPHFGLIFFSSSFPDDLSWQIGSSGCLASWPQTVCFLTSVSPSCWQTNAPNQCNQASTGLRIRRGNCKDSRRIRAKSAQLLRENPASNREQIEMELCVPFLPAQCCEAFSARSKEVILLA